MKKIGIVGLGYVGNAVRFSYQKNASHIKLIEIDIDPSKNCHGTYQELKDADVVFVCVPSPPKEDGSCDSGPLESVLDNLKDFKGVIISKVTATPDIYEKLQKKFPNLVHSPEFLTAANSVQDYLHSSYAIIGGSNENSHKAYEAIKIGLPDLKLAYCSTIGEASLAKYIINTFLATKVVFMNEMEKLARIGGHNWEVIRSLIATDSKRIGNSHTQVPGPDGQYGFGGICLPKDTLALLKYAECISVQTNVLDAAVKKNIIIRLQNSK